MLPYLSNSSAFDVLLLPPSRSHMTQLVVTSCFLAIVFAFQCFQCVAIAGNFFVRQNVDGTKISIRVVAFDVGCAQTVGHASTPLLKSRRKRSSRFADPSNLFATEMSETVRWWERNPFQRRSQGSLGKFGGFLQR